MLKDLLSLLDKAMKEDKEIVAKKVILKETEALLQLSGGDGRRLLNNFEVVVQALKGKKTITNDFVSAVNDMLVVPADPMTNRLFKNPGCRGPTRASS